MRKHFLILMLMALLPLAGWAQENVGFTDADGNELAEDFATYDATEKDLPKPATIGGEAIQQYVVSYTWYKTTVNANNQVVKTGSAIEKFTDAGKYLCEFTVNQGNYQGNHTGIYEIEKCPLTVTANDLIGDNALTYGDQFTDENLSITFAGWPEAIETDEAKQALIDGFGTYTFTTDYVPFTSGVTDMTADPVVYYQIVPVITGLVSNNYDFEAVHGKLQIVAKDMSEAATTDYSVTINNVFYNGVANAPILVVKDNANPQVTLELDEDYTLTYYSDAAGETEIDAPVHVGNYYVRINGAGNYHGQFSPVYTYKIRPERLEFTLKEPTITYDAQSHDLATLTLYDYDGLNAADQIASIAVVLQDGTAAKPTTLADLMTTGDNPTAITSVTNVAYNSDGYKIKSIVPTFTTGSAAQAGDYTVVINTEYFKIEQAPIEITIKNQTMHEDETDAIKAGIAIVITGANANVGTYLTVSATKKPVGTDAITAYPNVIATQDNAGTWNIGFKLKNNKADYPTVKKGNTDVSRNYEFTINTGVLTIISDLGILYVTPQSEVYGGLTKKGFVRVKVSGGSTADNEALATLLNNDKVTIAIDGDEESDTYGEQVGVSLDDEDAVVEYPNAGIYQVAYDESIYESETWLALTASYDINLTGRTTYTISKAPLKIKLNDQSLNAGDGIDDLEKDHYTIKFTGVVNDDNEEDLYNELALAFGGAVQDEEYLEDDALTEGAAAYDADEDDDDNELGYFEGGITVDADNTVFANYKYAASDITPAGLHVSVAPEEAFALVEEDAYDDDDENDPAVLLAAANNKKMPTVEITLNRDQNLVSGEGDDATILHKGTWGAKMWNTMVLPFNVTVEELSAQLGYAIVNVVNPDKTSGTNIAFRLEMDEIPANTPFTVKSNKAIADGRTLTFQNKTIKYVAEPSVEAGGQNYTFKANYAGLTIDNESDGLLKFLYGDMEGWGRVLAGKDYTWNIAPFAAYIDLTQAEDANAAREVTFTMEELDGSTTVIRNISAETASKLNNVEGWYTINGIKLQGAPTEKGIYINNGKKVVLK